MAEKVVLVPRTGAATFDLDPGARPGVDSVVHVVEAAEERRHRHAHRMGEGLQGGKRGRGVAVLDLGEHADGEAGAGREIGDGQAALVAEGADLASDRDFEDVFPFFPEAVGILVQRRCAHL